MKKPSVKSKTAQVPAPPAKISVGHQIGVVKGAHYAKSRSAGMHYAPELPKAGVSKLAGFGGSKMS